MESAEDVVPALEVVSSEEEGVLLVMSLEAEESLLEVWVSSLVDGVVWFPPPQAVKTRIVARENSNFGVFLYIVKTSVCSL